MRIKKDFKVAFFVIFCILLDLSGKYFAVSFQLPVCLDSIGTVLAAYRFGSLSGAIVGVTVIFLRIPTCTALRVLLSA